MAALDSSLASRIVDSWRLERTDKSGDEPVDRTDWLLAVAPLGAPMMTEAAYLESERKLYVGARMQGAADPAQAAMDAMQAWRAGPREAAVRRWRARLLWFVSADRHGDELRRALPFQWPADPRAEGLFQIRLTPDGYPDLVPAPDDRYPDAKVNPDACLVTKSDDPMVVARWWWAFEYGGFPRASEVKMYRIDAAGNREFLTRTEG